MEYVEDEKLNDTSHGDSLRCTAMPLFSRDRRILSVRCHFLFLRSVPKYLHAIWMSLAFFTAVKSKSILIRQCVVKTRMQFSARPVRNTFLPVALLMHVQNVAKDHVHIAQVIESGCQIYMLCLPQRGSKCHSGPTGLN